MNCSVYFYSIVIVSCRSFCACYYLETVMPHLPRHKFMGPGTLDMTAEPVDEDDMIAREHDMSYLSNPANAHSADGVATSKFVSDFLETGNVHSAIGAAGLGVKYVIEGLSGHQFYPAMPVDRSKLTLKKQAATDSGISSMASSDTLNTGMMADSSATASTSVSGPSTPPSALGGGPMHQGSQPSNVTLIYSKSFQCTTYGFNYGKCTYNTADFLMTPYCCFPVHKPVFYMTPAEFDQLPTGAFAVSCEVKVTPKYYRTPFQTNTTTTTTANSSMGVSAMSGIGLNQMLACGAFAIEFDLTTPTKPSNIKDPDDFSAKMYGEHGAISMGASRHINSYTGFTYEDTPLLTTCMSSFSFNDQINVPIVNYHYKFRQGLLKSHNKLSTSKMPAGNIPSGNIHKGGMLTTGITPAVYNHPMFGDTNQFTFLGKGILTYSTPLEKAAMCGFMESSISSCDMPSLHFGITPSLSGGLASSVDTIAEVYAFWHIETKLTVEVPFHSPLGYRMQDNQNSMKYLYQKSSEDWA